jgi:hypothetical protein
MRHFYCILIFFFVLSCKSEIDLSSGKIVSLKGNLDSKYPISMWIIEKQDVIFGQVKYENASNKPIRLVGVPYKEGIELVEFLDDGEICGIWKGKFEKNGYIGYWYSVEGNKNYKFILEKNDTILSDIDTNIITTNYVGNYRYRHGENGPEGYISIDKKENYFTLTCSNVTGEPSRNIANFQIDTLRIINNKSICDLNKDGLCVFMINFYNDFIIINSIDGKRDCGFGLNANVDGIYVKTNK